jgi:hypothetical protein
MTNSVNDEEVKSRMKQEIAVTDHFEISRDFRVADAISHSRNSTEMATQLPLPESTSSILLQEIRSSEISEAPLASEQGTNRNVSALAPVDGGFGAWSYVHKIHHYQNTY